ncbi:hypothetical protein C4D60_Mb04t23370 [Musa balbisiana]|uniref:Uncharacterized protein n=1 Tax=Musa balbisiana TaxID=52838 RepID=A0A4S8KEC8_MUSBA|nr:hypothetical protein C4D60_Mb04t23370 [Musa balbisiana]
MGRIIRSCLQSALKLVNSVAGFVGVGLILYSLWMIRVWYRQTHALPTADSWFIYTSLGLGVSFCLIAFSGHIAAETANVFLLVILEAAITADVILNRDWEEDFPEDKTGRFNGLKNFIGSNFELCKWISLVIVVAQAMSLFVAMILRALGPYHGNCYDSDDEYLSARLPLLRNQVQHTQYVGDPSVQYRKSRRTISLSNAMDTILAMEWQSPQTRRFLTTRSVVPGGVFMRPKAIASFSLWYRRLASFSSSPMST